MSELPEVTEILRYRYEPGDKIIVRCEQSIDMETAGRLRELVSQSLGVPCEDVLTVADGLVIEVAGKP